MPPSIKALLEDRDLLASAPHWFALPGKRFIIEVQYYVDAEKQSSEDVSQQRFVFAITTEGSEMLVDLHDPDLNVFQRELGEVDLLGFNITDFLAAAAKRMVVSAASQTILRSI